MVELLLLLIVNGGEKGEGEMKGRELGYPPHRDRIIENVEQGVAPTGNQQPYPQHLTPERSRRDIRGD